MSEPVRGIIHVHSDFSRDGLCSISDLADFAREAGFQFVGLTDHAEDISSEDMKSLSEECDRHSNESFVMIPGLEFQCSGDIHILGLGVTDHNASNDPVVVASQIRAKGGLAILAHPGRNAYQCPRELYTMLNGIEIWNAGYDGRFVPRLANLRLLQEARATNPSVLGFGGADIHFLELSPGVVLQLTANGSPGIDGCLVLELLRSGKFSVCGRYMSFDASTPPYHLGGLSLWTLRKLYEVLKAIRQCATGDP